MEINNLNSLLPLETKRLIIKRTTIDDINLIMKMDKQEITQKFLGGIKNKTKEERIEFLKKRTNSMTICLKDNKPIGFIEMKINKNIGELSYIFDYDYCNKGYCTEACQEIINSCFNNLNIKIIKANIVENNNSSIRVLEKLNFKYINTETIDNTKFFNYELNK